MRSKLSLKIFSVGYIMYVCTNSDDLCMKNSDKFEPLPTVNLGAGGIWSTTSTNAGGW